MSTAELPTPTPLPGGSPILSVKMRPVTGSRTIGQLLRFGLVGGVNTLIDILALNCLIWLWQPHTIWLLLLANFLAFLLGALNSFFLNRFWTFQQRGRVRGSEVARFAATTLASALGNDFIFYLLNNSAHPGQFSPLFWTNFTKIVAIGGTVLISYLGMRLWVFVQAPQGKPGPARSATTARSASRASQESASESAQPHLSGHSLSLVLPAYNEEQIIAATVQEAMRVLEARFDEFEVIVVNDGSSDNTGDALAQLSRNDARIRVITHEHNQGYGAALVSGFAAACKELTLFMDSDGQFDLRDLDRLLPFVEDYAAVIGYRVERQDTWMRKLNAWGWKQVVRLALGVRACDIDCAFKILRTSFLHAFPLETRGAMINAELLYKLKCAGYTPYEVGVRHLPRQGGRATGARLSVIARAFSELFLYARRWRRAALIATLACGSADKQRRASAITVDLAEPPARDAALRDQKDQPLSWPQRLALLAITLTSIFLNFYHLGQNGFGNLFYAAGVRSMADSLHNFFFVAYDPGGFVTVDKPPLGFWLQTVSVKLLGFTPFSIFLPQALAGVLAVLILFYLVRRHFCCSAGLLAALALALSPLSVATARNNTIDSTLVLALLLATWAIMLATETGRWRWLLLSAGLIGLGFNIKMMEAYLVVPAFGLLYLFGTRRSWRVRLGQLLIALLFLLTVSLAWAAVVDLTPASQRPYVGSSLNNSEISLAFGYNGVQRLIGHFGFGSEREAKDVSVNVALPPSSSIAHQLLTSALEKHEATNLPFARLVAQEIIRSVLGIPAIDFAVAPAPARSGELLKQLTGHHGMNTDSPGPVRLFNQAIGGQISWLLPFALLGLLALAWQRRPRFQQDRQQQALLLWGTWLFTMGIFFSAASFFHTYYMTTFAPAICALFGIGCVLMWQDYRRAGWRGWLLPCALILTAAEQVHFIVSNPAWGTWLIPLIACTCTLAALLLLAARLMPRTLFSRRAPQLALGAGLAALLLTPGLWSAMPALQNNASRTPSAGPAQQNFFDRDGSSANPALIHYLEAHEGNAVYLAAAPSSRAANTLILATNRPVMAMGGFAGSDPILTPAKLASLVSAGDVRFFLINQPGTEVMPFARSASAQAARNLSPFSFGRNNQPALTNWITHHCVVVPPGQWQTGSTGGMQLYDCKAER